MEIDKMIDDIQCEINALEAKKWTLINNYAIANGAKLFEEVLNCYNSCGKGFVQGDYYAPSRYYSEIPGVKNIRLTKAGWRREMLKDCDYVCEIKIVDKRGLHLANYWENQGVVQVADIKCRFVTVISDKYTTDCH